jgi:Na+/phosphate symporter
MNFLLTGVILLLVILGLFWLMDQLQSPMLTRIAYSGLIARLAVVGAVFAVLGLLMMLSEFVEGWGG